MGGLWAVMPRMGAVMMFFAVAAMGLPGIGNFIAEFLVLLGTFQANTTAAVTASVIASGGLVLSTLYSVHMIRSIFFGSPSPADQGITDLAWREAAVVAPIIIALLWVGLYPQPILNTVAISGQKGSPPIYQKIKKSEPVLIYGNKKQISREGEK